MSLGAAAVVFVATSYAVAALRRGNVKKHVVGASEIALTTSAAPRAAFEAIKQLGAPYRVDDADSESLRLVLSSRPNVFSVGFFYPIEIEPVDGGSKVIVGVRSRFLFGGIIQTTRAHERCARAIEALFTLPPARLA